MSLPRVVPAARVFVLSLSLLLPSAPKLATAATVDQQYTNAPANQVHVINDVVRRIAQTFTAGISGRLVGVNVDIRGLQNHPLRISIRTTTAAGVPAVTVLGSTQLSTSGSDLGSLVTFSDPIPIEAGRTYCIVADYPTAIPGSGNALCVWNGSSFRQYAGGAPYGFYVDPPAPSTVTGWQRMGGDLYFRTYVNREPDCSGATAARPAIWPPNRRLVPVEIVGVTDADGDPITVTATGVTQDEPTRGGLTGSWLSDDEPGPGSGVPSGVPSVDPCADAVIVDGVAYVRAEFAGNGNGRVYEVSFVATDVSGGQCGGSVQVCVPHRPGGECVDDGQTVNSLECGGAAESARSGPARLTALRAMPERGTVASVEYRLEAAGPIVLSIHDVAGRRVATIEAGHRQAGVHRAVWSTDGVVPGVYFCRLRTERDLVTVPLAVVR